MRETKSSRNRQFFAVISPRVGRRPDRRSYGLTQPAGSAVRLGQMSQPWASVVLVAGRGLSCARVSKRPLSLFAVFVASLNEH